MDRSISNWKKTQNVPPRAVLPMRYKDCAGELKIRALERFLSAIYLRPVTLLELLQTGGLPSDSVSALQYKNLNGVAEQLIAHIRMKFFNYKEGGTRMYEIVERYYGLDGNLPARLAGIATKHGISRERIRQLKERCLRSLRYGSSIRYIEETLTRLAARAANGQSAYLYGQLQRHAAIEFKLKNHRELLICSQPRDVATVEQIEVLNLIDSHKRMRIDGCVGSGKTWLALETARKLAGNGKRTLLTCFNRALADYLNSIIAPDPNLVISSFHSLCMRLGKQTGISTPGGWNNRAWNQTIPDLIRRAVNSNPALKFDAVIIDDAHELLPPWWLALIDGLTDGEQGRMYAFFDDNLPVAARPESTIPSFDCRARLTMNLRSPADVESVLTTSAGNPMRFTGRLSEAAEFYRCNTDDDVRATLAHIFIALEESGLDTSQVAVLTPRLTKLSSVGNMKLRGTTRLVKSDSLVSNHAMLSRINTFHGLERKVIIVVEMDDKKVLGKFSDLASLVYLAFSRHTERLIVLGSHHLWELLNDMHRSHGDRFFIRSNVMTDVPSQMPIW